jgi:hypothetical protein
MCSYEGQKEQEVRNRHISFGERISGSHALLKSLRISFAPAFSSLKQERLAYGCGEQNTKRHSQATVCGFLHPRNPLIRDLPE